jgi:putative transposase
MRPPRLIVPGYAHHVTQRGVRKSPTFYDESDHLVYTRVLHQACTTKQVEIMAYCLMPNHVHLIAIPTTEKGLSEALRDAHTAYAMYFNVKHGFVGHTWQSRPWIFVLDENHLWNAVRYVERNPVKAGIVEAAERYEWSSAAAHCGLRDDLLLTRSRPLLIPTESWAEWLSAVETAEQVKRMREHSAAEKPLGSPEFLRVLELKTGRKFVTQKRGRRKKLQT